MEKVTLLLRPRVKGLRDFAYDAADEYGITIKKVYRKPRQGVCFDIEARHIEDIEQFEGALDFYANGGGFGL